MRRGKPFTEHMREFFDARPDMEDDFYEELFKLKVGEEIRRVRCEKKLTQGQLAKMINTSQSTIARLENADNFSYSMRTLLKISGVLDKELSITFKERQYREALVFPETRNVVSIDDYRATMKGPGYLPTGVSGEFDTSVKNAIIG
jgi:transcriptional regulator with XRE-family HTH domain